MTQKSRDRGKRARDCLAGEVLRHKTQESEGGGGGHCSRGGEATSRGQWRRERQWQREGKEREGGGEGRGARMAGGGGSE